MLILISPAKNLDFQTKTIYENYSIPQFRDQAETIMAILRKYRPNELQALLNVNKKLAIKNFERNLLWQKEHNLQNSRQALLAFNGEVFRGIKASTYTNNNFEQAQAHLRIISGLYGILKPLDLIQPYRLEMGIKLKNPFGETLYELWGNLISRSVEEQLKLLNTNIIINLASAEYFKAIKLHNNIKVITPVFMERRNNELKPIVIYMKKARGLLTSFIIKNKIGNPDELKYFDQEGYAFQEKISEELFPVFVR